MTLEWRGVCEVFAGVGAMTLSCWNHFSFTKCYWIFGCRIYLTAKPSVRFHRAGTKQACSFWLMEVNPGLTCSFSPAMTWKLLLRVGGFTLPMVTVSECVLGLLVSFSTMQGCSEPIALQMHQQGSIFIFSGRKLKNLAPFGARGFFFVVWPQNIIVFTCVSMTVWSSILAATAKSWVQGEGSQKNSTQGAVI